MNIKNDFFQKIFQYVINICCFVKYVAVRTKQDRLLRIAASLSYTTLIALVPLLAIAVAIFTAFPVFSNAREELQGFVFDNLLLPETGKVVQQYLLQFVGATGKLTTVGVAGLVLTAIIMLTTIESAFNVIFRVTRPRPVITRVLVYWTSLTLGPLLLGASFSLSGYLFALRKLVDKKAFAVADSFLTEMTPAFLLAVAFMLLYMTIPYRSVKLKNAAVGGIAAAFLFGVLRSSFGLFAANAATYQTLYGAMAVLPMFLIWMYMSWAVVLAGAVITAALPEWKSRGNNDNESTSSASKISLIIDIDTAKSKNKILSVKTKELF